MPSDIRLNDSSVIIEGRLGLGTDNPQLPMHVATGEIHSSGPKGGLSFTGRDAPPGSLTRWVWYADRGEARLSLTHDAISVRPAAQPARFEVNVSGRLSAAEVAGQVTGPLLGQREGGSNTLDSVRCRARGLALNDPAAPTFIEGPITEVVSGTGRARQVIDEPTPPIPPQQTPIPPRIALFHEFGPGHDGLVINAFGRYAQGVRVEGNLKVNGAVTEASSRTVKEDIATLDADEALAALAHLTPVTYRYRADHVGHEQSRERRVGFVAEDVPDLVAHSERDRLSAMDIVAVLTRAVQQQQKMISDLTERLRALPDRGSAA